ncbi:hypothetical protein QJS04_geneDACA004118 [Acorus gramineus]|uniref:Uncharacterized protein n=1 Tax=Acorus gramineus TaxID=55184 RepID=A0AAV9BG23_ACOGR|nr:hypothetical protein QJS04_geneDACA004118 [Acorus gramineus]
MGCSASKLEDEEAVQLCKDRKRFIREAIEHRLLFASGHIAYIQSLKRVSAVLCDYVECEEERQQHREFLSDSYLMTPPFTPVKRISPGIIGVVPLKSFSASTAPHVESQNGSKRVVVNYLRSGGGNPSVLVEERPRSPEIVRVESYSYSPIHRFGMESYFYTQNPSPMNPSFFSSSPYNRPHIAPPSPQTTQWDYFWNPFTSLDNYGYSTRDSLDRMVGGDDDDDVAGLRQLREEEGIPELEEEEEKQERQQEREPKVVVPEANVENAQKAETSGDDDDDDDGEEDIVYELKGFRAQGAESVGVSEAPATTDKERAVEGKKEGAAEETTPGFTVYVNRKPTSMSEVMRDIENQFMVICDSGEEVSAMLEANKAHYSSVGRELTPVKMLNPVALLRSASSRSTSSRFFHGSTSSSRDEDCESCSDFSEDSCVISGSHQSTLDRLYAWEKKLYEEVKSGERIRIAYEKKLMQFRNQDAKGEDPSVMDKTRTAIRDLHTRIKVSIHSVESVAERIENLRDEELQPQLMELLQGLARMWRAMADGHRSQKRAIDEAKPFLLNPRAPAKLAEASPPMRVRPAASVASSAAAARLEAEVRNWRACFEAWIAEQRSYARALAGWVVRCARPHDRRSWSVMSPPRVSGGGGAHPVYGICLQWSRMLDEVSEAGAVDGLDFFAAGMGSEMGIRVLWAGLAVAVGALGEFAVASAEGYEGLLRRLEGVGVGGVGM